MLPLSAAIIACCTRVRYCFLGLSDLISDLSDSLRLKLVRQGETHRPRLDRMKVYVSHALAWFAWQTRDIKIIDVVILRVEQVEHLELGSPVLVLITRFQGK